MTYFSESQQMMVVFINNETDQKCSENIALFCCNICQQHALH